jgi:hypothetical protein
MAMLQSMMGINITDTNGMNMLTALQSLPGAGSSSKSPLSFSIARRNFNAPTSPFQIMQSTVGVTQSGQSIQGQGLSTTVVMSGDAVNVRLSGVSQLDGEYVLLVTTAPGGGDVSLAKNGKSATSGSRRVVDGVSMTVISATFMVISVLFYG